MKGVFAEADQSAVSDCPAGFPLNKWKSVRYTNTWRAIRTERLFSDSSKSDRLSYTYEGRFCVQGEIGGKIYGTNCYEIWWHISCKCRKDCTGGIVVQGEVSRGNQVAVIVSAMGKTTDDLLKLAVEVNPKRSRRELDMLLATGEQVTASLSSDGNCGTRFGGTLIYRVASGLTTESVHGNARIEQVQADKIVTTLESGAVAVITGFQGADSSGELTTLGRGGSDTSAVAIAIAIDAACL